MKNIQTNFQGFRVMGTGPRLLICFHGYGQTVDVFSPLSKMQDKYTLLSIALPYHSDNYALDRKLSVNYPLGIYHFILYFAKKHQFNSWEICGYSIGARLAQFCYTQNPKKCDALYLVAPDGVGQNYFFSTVTHRLFNPLFKKVMKRSDLLIKSIQLIRKTRVISASLSSFAQQNIGSKEQSQKVANTWIALRKAKISNSKLLYYLEEYNTPYFLVRGKFDKIITAKKLRGFTKKAPVYRVIALPANHVSVLTSFFQWFKEKRLKNED
ncbi:alpha/beta fold hydrolase [Flammeovirga agarivorans]|uniref:Alpha/beta hydrolase n=1 Tax=Flammeovirga agarivorans TaxID=2726742 RepID=A0A7X8SIW4_9BACT|nr:alpha/beta hydrolase [Flammeovirga agarivorans]NLR91061.1 alpha/beta hydrolase [Flammeovirga agarivorans]